MSFTDERQHKAYVCNHVFERTRPILLVSRPEGDWCFLCGGEHENDAAAYKVIGIGHMFDLDPSLAGLEDLQANWEAERTETDLEWVRSAVPVE